MRVIEALIGPIAPNDGEAEVRIASVYPRVGYASVLRPSEGITSLVRLNEVMGYGPRFGVLVIPMGLPEKVVELQRRVVGRGVEVAGLREVEVLVAAPLVSLGTVRRRAGLVVSALAKVISAAIVDGQAAGGVSCPKVGFVGVRIAGEIDALAFGVGSRFVLLLRVTLQATWAISILVQVGARMLRVSLDAFLEKIGIVVGLVPLRRVGSQAPCGRVVGNADEVAGKVPSPANP